MTLGATLRHARITRGLTREAVARATRIPVRMIAAIENEQWEALPGGIYARGYVRAYSQEVGIDPEEHVARYSAEHAPSPPRAVPVETDESQARRWIVRWPDWHISRAAWPALAAVVLALLLAGLFPLGRKQAEQAVATTGGPDATPESSLGREISAPVGAVASPAVKDPASSDPPRTPPAVAGPLVMDVEVTRLCWLAVTVDGSRRIYRLVRPGERERQEGREFAIRAGDAGAVRVSFDGDVARPLGASGRVVTLRLTRANYRSALDPGSTEVGR
jgi:cytoskeleton protein RodZ